MMASSQSFSRIHWRMLLSPCPASPVNNAEPLWTVESNIRQWILENDWLEADRKSTRLNSSHLGISYAVFFLKKKTKLTFKRTIRSSTFEAFPRELDHISTVKPLSVDALTAYLRQMTSHELERIDCGVSPHV